MDRLFENLTIATRVYLAVAIALLGMLIISAIGLMSLRAVSGDTENLIQQNFQLDRAMGDLRGAVGNLRRYEKDAFINLANKEKVAEYRKKWTAALGTAHKAVNTARPLSEGVAQAEAITKLGKDIDLYAKGFIEVADQLEAGKFALTSDANHAMTAHKQAIRELEGAVDKLSAEVGDSTASSADSLMKFMHQISMALIVAATSPRFE